MAAITLPNDGWAPRPYQMPAWNALMGGTKRACLVWHRRAGKDSMALNFTAVQTQLRVGSYIHFLPYATQAKRVVWQGVDREGRRIINQVFPEAMRANTRNDEMSIEFKNGSFWYCAGSDNYEALLGTNPVGVVFSEYSIGDPLAWEYIRPILVENGGWAIFIYTPRGENHGFDLYEVAKTNPNWFCQLMPLSASKAYPESIVDEEIADGMDPELARQEFYCSFQAPRLGAILGHEMENAEIQKRITAVPYETSLPVHTAWDLGTSDDTAIVLFQMLGGEIRIVDFIHDRGQGFPFYVDLLKKRKELYRFTWGDFCLPHDIVVQDLATGKTRLRALKTLMEGQGMADHAYKVGTRMKYPDTLVPIREALARSYFDRTRTGHLVKALKNYRREYDDRRKIYRDVPLHDWSSHPVDAFRELAIYATRGRHSSTARANALIKKHRESMSRSASIGPYGR